MMNKLQFIEDLQRKVFSLFDYVHDIDNYMVMEHWESHADLVEQNKRFKDDCDGYAMTVCELLIKNGFDRKDVLFVICETETGEGHAVAGVTIDDETYILENRYRHLYNWRDRTNYTWNYFMSFDKPGSWKKITNDKTNCIQ
jgi:predicted transglutaminase-like cysteine proteinase